MANPYLQSLYTGFQAGSQYNSPYEDFQKQMLVNTGNMNAQMQRHYNALEQSMFEGRIRPDQVPRVVDTLNMNRQQFNQGLFTPAMGTPYEEKPGTTTPKPVGPQYGPPLPPPAPPPQQNPAPLPEFQGPPYAPKPPAAELQPKPSAPPAPPAPQKLIIHARSKDEAFRIANAMRPRPKFYVWSGNNQEYHTRYDTENPNAWKKNTQVWQPPQQ